MIRETTHEILRVIIQVGIGLSVAFLGIFFDKTEFINALNGDPIDTILILLLLFATLAWFSNYVYVNIQDVEVLPKDFPNIKSSVLTLSAVFLMIGTSLSFGMLLATIHRIKTFLCAASIFSILDLTSDIGVLKLMSHGLYGEQKATKAQQIHYRFYFQRPTLFRDVISLSCFVIPLIVCYLFNIQLNRIISIFLYLLCISSILVTEIIIMRWRLTRNKELLKIR
jgi:hypothetical protein